MSFNSALIKYFAAVFLSIFGIVLHIIFSPHFNFIPFILAMPTIFIICTFWGFRAALLSIAIWSYGLSYYYFEPLYSIRINSASGLIEFFLFLITAITVSWMVELSKKKEHKLEMVEEENRARNLHLEVENKLKDQFVNTLSHDLKNPLALAMMCTDIISKKKMDSDLIKDLATKATSSLRRIDYMIQDLLDSRRISAGNPLNMDMAKFDLSELLKNITKDFTSLHGDRFYLKLSEHVEFVGSEKYIQRAIENLVSNAIKYGDEVRPIEIGLETRAKEIAIYVRNWGNVLTTDQIEKVSKVFVRLNPEDSSKKGWGIGLTLVRAIVEGHKGVLDITSNEIGGTTFQMRFPLTQ